MQFVRQVLVPLTFWGAAAEISFANSLTIDEAVARAVTTSPRIRGAQADRDAAKEKRRGAWADLGPRLKAEYSQVRFEDAQKFQMGPTEITLRPEEVKSGSLTLAQPITGLYALAERARMEGSQEDQKDLMLQAARTEVALQTADSWLKAYGAQRQLQIAQASVEAALSQQKDAAALERVGRLNRGDVLRLELAVSEAKARVATTRAGRDIVIAALREAIDVEPGTPVDLAETLPLVPADDPELAEALKVSRETRIERRMAENGVTLAGFGRSLALSQFSPNINLFAKLDHNFGEPAGLGASGRDTRSVGVMLSWDLWNNGSSTFAVREAAQQVIRAGENVAGIDEQIRLDVQAAIYNLKAARESLSLATVAVNQAEEAYRIEQARFKTGARSSTDLILAEAARANAQGRRVAAETDIISWYMKLQKAQGLEILPKQATKGTKGTKGSEGEPPDQKK